MQCKAHSVMRLAEYAKRLAAILKTVFKLLPDVGAFLEAQEFPSDGTLLHNSAMACNVQALQQNIPCMIPETTKTAYTLLRNLP